MNAIHPLEQVRRRGKPSLMKFVTGGGWCCEHCGRVSFLSLDLDEPARCPHCKKSACKYYPPAFEVGKSDINQ